MSMVEEELCRRGKWISFTCGVLTSAFLVGSFFSFRKYMQTDEHLFLTATIVLIGLALCVHRKWLNKVWEDKW